MTKRGVSHERVSAVNDDQLTKTRGMASFVSFGHSSFWFDSGVLVSSFGFPPSQTNNAAERVPRSSAKRAAIGIPAAFRYNPASN
jgi:hypothetical protein